MDFDRLDVLARSVAVAGSRRRLLGLLATLPAVVAGAPEDAGARRRKRRRKHPSPQPCTADSACANPTPICRNGVCVACSATLGCAAGCCDMATGACRATCPACQTCSGGVCVADASQDQSCCAGAAGERWCEAGACVPVPTDTRATLEECTGRCDCVPYPPNGCFGGTPAYLEICGAKRFCPLCEQCPQLVSGCPGARDAQGPAGYSYYCAFDADQGVCKFGAPCPHPESQICLEGTQCVNICGVMAP
ncbi:MAG: hypothetical protein U0075_21805 [Thermomicrobiales bacterium]